MTGADRDALQLRTIELRDFPLEVFDRARQHGEALLREFAFIAEGSEDDAHVPRRLLDLVAALNDRYSTMNAAAEEQIEAALQRGDGSIDFELHVPPEAREASVELAARLDEADEYCRRGELLTLATPEDLRDFRLWYLQQVIDQIDGRPPTSWNEWSRSVDREHLREP
jgi:hypothetical protein